MVVVVEKAFFFGTIYGCGDGKSQPLPREQLAEEEDEDLRSVQPLSAAAPQGATSRRGHVYNPTRAPTLLPAH